MKIENGNVIVKVETGCSDCPFCHVEALSGEDVCVLNTYAIKPMNAQCPLKNSEVIVKLNR